MSANPVAPIKEPSPSLSEGSSLRTGEQNSVTGVAPPLGAQTTNDRKFWWEGGDKLDPEAIATQPSVYDDPDLAPSYQPRPDWENIHRFNPLARWTWGEEKSVVRKVDGRIMVWVCVMFFALEMDRGNLGNAVSDDLLGDLGLTTNDFNLGNTLFALSYLVSELPSQLISKWIGPDRWIPAQVTLWSVVAMCQFRLSGKTSFLVCRSLLGLIQGGFVPDIILYMSYFYKHHEMTIRLGFFYLAMSAADVASAFIAYGILHMRGVYGLAGWRWLFLIEGALTLCIGLGSFIIMPAGPTETAGNLRGKDGWFTKREEEIMVNRIIRDDPTKGSMHNRQPVTPSLLWKCICDYDLWPLYAFALTALIAYVPVGQYLPLNLRAMGFSVFQTNLLIIPTRVIAACTTVALMYFAERMGQTVVPTIISQLWTVPPLIWLAFGNRGASDRWQLWGVITAMMAKPFAHPLTVNLVSRNSSSVRTRTVSAALYNMFTQACIIIGSNIYRADDRPHYRRGNTTLLVLVIWNIVLLVLIKVYYVRRNRTRERKWDALATREKAAYIAAEGDRGNRGLDFRFKH
ncbi:hypothetical protein GGTG_02270 [Gaeumannomyces tritici R3-111a-1]|uniref:Major facilitator superfamily (MFS) profile domain-containing protein n=1 Tax=Gaeumannomyces tritici (strain R3-111a-1) TaxID=644352 RepID=J3NLW5_GAET3|nr:hypothetical protein GGTG_02270 [Gaeumannomyces tritici R3-111a-1]EJT82296.1 hypothetical protein GGTG_02270 [Gaeumannomyces tritici R3-111a-1]